MIILSIVIPQYSEDDKKVKPLLQSIDIQHGIDFSQIEVIIVNDGSDTLLTDALLAEPRNYKPKYIKIPHAGPGLCRQAGLDAAQGEYVTFCDADDIYHNVGVLSLYFEIIRSQRPQIIHTSWLEEIKTEDGHYLYITHSHENTWMHGKVYNRGFLMFNNLRFSDELFYHEDSYFNSNVTAMCDEGKSVYHDAVTFMWAWGGGRTITRRNEGAYSYESMEEFTHSIRLSCRWLKDHRPQIVPEKVVQCLCYVFYCVTKGMQNGSWNKKYVEAVCREMYAFYDEFRAEFASVPLPRISEILLGERNKINEPYIEEITFYAFMQDLETKLKEDKELCKA